MRSCTAAATLLNLTRELYAFQTAVGTSGLLGSYSIEIVLAVFVPGFNQIFTGDPFVFAVNAIAKKFLPRVSSA